MCLFIDIAIKLAECRTNVGLDLRGEKAYGGTHMEL
jgi:hypothetical protein